MIYIRKYTKEFHFIINFLTTAMSELSATDIIDFTLRVAEEKILIFNMGFFFGSVFFL